MDGPGKYTKQNKTRNSDKNYTLSPMQTLACLYINGVRMGTDCETRKETVRGKRC